MKRALSLIIALLMLSASFASCSEKQNDETEKLSQIIRTNPRLSKLPKKKSLIIFPRRISVAWILLFTHAKSLRIPLFSLRKLTEKS